MAAVELAVSELAGGQSLLNDLLSRTTSTRLIRHLDTAANVYPRRHKKVISSNSLLSGISGKGRRRSSARLLLPASRAPLLPGIIILNARYFPDSEFSAAKVGATSFAFSAMDVLQEAGLFAGMILYKRDESIGLPRLVMPTKTSFPCVTLAFNFDMDWMTIRDAISNAAERLTIATYGTRIKSILYHQTDILLAYNPDWLPSCVTHHGPFHDDFASHFSAEEAAVAFGSCEKAEHLKTHQRIGLKHLRSAKNMFVLQHSSLQRNYLLRHHVEPSRIQKLSPPINIERLPRLPLASTHPDIVKFMNAKSSLLLFTAVARLDFFKNIELLVDASVELLGQGRTVRVLVAGDDEDENHKREELLTRVPDELKSEFMIIPKLSKDSLYALFDEVNDSGIFVCTSRYETLGITPLEAGLSGVPTVIVDSPTVEASAYYPKEYRFEGSIAGLTDLVQGFQDSGMTGRGRYLRGSIEEHISHEKFRKSMLDAWRVFSIAAYESKGGKKVKQTWVFKKMGS